MLELGSRIVSAPSSYSDLAPQMTDHLLRQRRDDDGATATTTEPTARTVAVRLPPPPPPPLAPLPVPLLAPLRRAAGSAA